MNKIFSNQSIRYSLLIIAGIFIGWLFFHPSHKDEEKQDHLTDAAQGTIWTCAMHPQIRMKEPGKCPICGMDLIPLTQNNAADDPDAIHLTKESAALANVFTSVVSHQKPVKEVRLYGKVMADERLLQSQVSHIPGRIEKLMVNFTGERVQKGQTLALIYSPELVTAQQELLESAKMKESQPEIYEAAKEKLRQWKMTENQIVAFENSGIAQNNFNIESNTTGIVTARRVNNGDYIAQGSVLYDVADLSNVWVMFDAYESDLQFLKIGDLILFTVQALPGIEYTGKILFIDPVIDPVTRVAKIRVEIANKQGRLKPEMFATGVVKAQLDEYRKNLIIPRSSVLWTGKRSIVYVKQPGTEPVFKYREVDLGPMLGNSYVVTGGLYEGEEIVTQGTFSIDAASQLEGKSSMMNPQGGKVSTGMAGMDMGEESNKNTVPKDAALTDHSTDQSMKMDMTVDIKFKEQLTLVYEKYLKVKDALFASDLGNAISFAKAMNDQLAKVDMTLLKGDNHLHWMELLGKLKNSLDEIGKSNDLDPLRISFSMLSSEMADAIKMFGLKDQTVYYQFCPMANQNKGAYWLSQFKEIKNPYMGSQMPNCGETKEILK